LEGQKCGPVGPIASAAYVQQGRQFLARKLCTVLQRTVMPVHELTKIDKRFFSVLAYFSVFSLLHVACKVNKQRWYLIITSSKFLT